MRAERIEELLRHHRDRIVQACGGSEVVADEIDRALALPADAPEGAGEAVAFSEDVEREQAADELARECFDGPALSAREADLWIEGWLARARHAHSTPRAEAASAEAVREACAAAVDREAGALEALIDESDDLPRWQAQKMPVVKKLREVASMLRSLPLPSAPASAEAVADSIIDAIVAETRAHLERMERLWGDLSRAASRPGGA